MIKKLTLITATVLILGGCDRWQSSSGFSQMGYKPVYAKSGNLNELIKSTSAQALTTTGKIYVKGNFLLVNRPYEGIHVIDNTDPAKPVNLAYIEIPGNLDVSMKGNYLYADYVGQIAVIDVSDISNPQITQTVKVDTEYQNYPPVDANNDMWRTYFECPDPSKGVVIGWTYTDLQSPKCWRDQQ